MTITELNSVNLVCSKEAGKYGIRKEEVCSEEAGRCGIKEEEAVRVGAEVGSRHFRCDLSCDSACGGASNSAYQCCFTTPIFDKYFIGWYYESLRQIWTETDQRQTPVGVAR